MAKATAAKGKARSKSPKVKGTGRSAGTGGTKRGKPTTAKKGSGPGAKRPGTGKGMARPGGKGGAAGAAASGKVMSKRPQDKASRVRRESRTGAPNPAGGSDQSAPQPLPKPPNTQDITGAPRQADQPEGGSGGDDNGYQG
jgi:hypothetical protein